MATPRQPKPTKLSSKPFTPRGAELGPLPMPTEEELTAELIAGAEAAGKLWDELMLKYAGLLGAEINGVTRQALACHPLAPLVLMLFLERAPQDATTVASALWNGRRFASYCVVASDILEDMKKAGLLHRSAAGWYWLISESEVRRLEAQLAGNAPQDAGELPAGEA